MSSNPFVVFTQTFREEFGRQMQRQARSASPRVETITESPLETESLRTNFGGAMSTLSEMFTSASRDQYGPLQLEAMEVNLEVSADGRLAFLGTGGGVSGKTSFKIQFKRRESEPGAPS